MAAATSQRTDLLFLCVANSARSQIAEGLARAMVPGSIGIHSAGSIPGRLHPLATRVLAEIGIDISHQRSKAIREVPTERIAIVITLCGEEECPVFPGEIEILHWPLADPSDGSDSARDALGRFRETRDAIRTRLRTFFDERATQTNAADPKDLDYARLPSRQA